MYTVEGVVFELSGVDFVPCKLVTADEFKSCVLVAVIYFDEVLVFVVAALWIACVHILNKARGVNRYCGQLCAVPVAVSQDN